jgi:hypothetical protein
MVYTAPPAVVAELPLTVQLVSVAPDEYEYRAAPQAEEALEHAFPVIVQFVSVGCEFVPEQYRPPPAAEEETETALLPLIVQFSSIGLESLVYIPPPHALELGDVATFPLIVQLVNVGLE